MATTRIAGVALAASLATALSLSACTAPTVTPPESWEPPPVAPVIDPLESYAEARLASMTLREKVASMIMIHVAGLDASVLRAQLERTGAAGLIYMGDNVPGSVGQLATTTASLSSDPGYPVLVSIDQEGGIVRRLPGDDAASPSQLRELPPSAAEDAFADRARLVASAGVAINFGIVADVTADRSAFIHPRVLGATAADAAPRVAAAVAGENGVVLSTLKHFPGHGAVAGDSHSSLPATAMSESEWLTTQAPPFIAGIEAGAELVMFGHVRYTSVDSEPATLSAEWHRVLREELGFEGVIVTDDMAMLQNSGVPEYADPIRNAVAAVAAGNDLLLYVAAVDVAAVAAAVVDAVERGEIAESSIDASALRLIVLRRELSGRTGPYITCDSDCRAVVG
ncbi:glycoside hydrolase family 3 N-terminal domain-containing protein [uncultured Schumannella sp.]|uniref:glycoside hydrolase family 3 N-terminal domain-containing protein n=1 Tax=uncultured Schumannella sp. TaxID=1195956 RepID=UPI0025D85051|nr:glycoside hydrolase family 3 N-terminal domain-containing protein [uncultured Schumannella sp.]